MTSSEHDALVEGLVAAGVRTPHDLPDDEALAEMRRAEAVASTAAAVAAAAGHGATVVDVDAGGVPVLRVDVPGSDAARAVVYFHGGGYLWMTPHSHVAVLAALARACGAPVFGVHYRRAPEEPFPAAVEDAVGAYRWLLDSGIEPGGVVFAGDSAGAGLVIAALLAARDEGLPMPAAGVCFSPWTDLAVTGASADTADDPIVDGPALRMMAAAYLQGADSDTPLASPLYAELAGLPPLLVQVGSREALLDDARRFVARAAEAEVEVTSVEHQGVIHMWIVFGPDLPESVRAFEIAGDFARSHYA
jgi:epsilon-lactone hydrolase